MKVEDLQPNTEGHNLVLKVVSIGKSYSIKSYDYEVTTVVEVLVGDETGCVLFNARNGRSEI